MYGDNKMKKWEEFLKEVKRLGFEFVSEDDYLICFRAKKDGYIIYFPITITQEEILKELRVQREIMKKLTAVAYKSSSGKRWFTKRKKEGEKNE